MDYIRKANERSQSMVDYMMIKRAVDGEPWSEKDKANETYLRGISRSSYIKDPQRAQDYYDLVTYRYHLAFGRKNLVPMEEYEYLEKEFEGGID